MATQDDPQSNIPGAPYRYATRPPGAHANLQPSEAAILNAAAQIYASHVIAGRVTPENELELIENAVTLAIRLAQRVDARVDSAEELDQK
jgi:hypothetical protein